MVCACHHVWHGRAAARAREADAETCGRRRHQLRGSVLPILTMCYNKTRQHLLTADEQALRLFSTRRELAVMWLDPESPSPMILLHHAIHDVRPPARVPTTSRARARTPRVDRASGPVSLAPKRATAPS